MEWSDDQRAAIRDQILEGLDWLEEKLREIIARGGQPLIRGDRVVTDPATGETVLDMDAVQDAEKELAAVRQQRDEMLGTGGDDVDQNIARLLGELDRRVAAGNNLAGGRRAREKRPTSMADCGTVAVEALPQPRDIEDLGITLKPWKCSASECGNEAAWLLTACPGTDHQGSVLICDEHSGNAHQSMREIATRPH